MSQTRGTRTTRTYTLTKYSYPKQTTENSRTEWEHYTHSGIRVELEIAYDGQHKDYRMRVISAKPSTSSSAAGYRSSLLNSSEEVLVSLPYSSSRVTWLTKCLQEDIDFTMYAAINQHSPSYKVAKEYGTPVKAQHSDLRIAFKCLYPVAVPLVGPLVCLFLPI